MKRYFNIIIGVLMAVTAHADVTIDNITYVLDATNQEAKVKTALKGVAFTDNKVTIPETITNEDVTYNVTGVEAFSNTGGKMELVLPKTIKYIKAVKSGIVTLNVPAAVTSITDMHESADLLDFKVDAGNETYCDVDGVLFSKDKKTLVYMPFGRNSQASLDYTVPDGTEQIGDYAFYKKTNLSNIELPDGLKEIGSYSFTGCTLLKRLVAPLGTERIMSHAFDGCSSILSLTLSKGLKLIGDYCFTKCTGLAHLTFPEGIEEIGSGTFEYCTNLTKIIFGEGLKTIKSNAFSSCYGLIIVEFPKSLETIEDRAFWRTMLDKVVLPENLQTIGWQAFIWAYNEGDSYTKHLQSLTIPAKVNKISEYAFGGYCFYNNHINNETAQRFSVDTIYVHMEPLKVPATAFGTRTNQTLVVPKGMRDVYSTTDSWMNAPNVIEGEWEPEFDASIYSVNISNTTIEEGTAIYQNGITYKLYAKEGRQARLYSDLKDYPDDVINLPEGIYYRANTYKMTGVEMLKSNRVVDLVIPNTVTSIQSVKSGVKTLNVPAAVTSITDMHESADLLDFKVDAGNETYCDVDGVLFSKDKKTLVYMPFGRNRQTDFVGYTIPNGTEEIGEYAFYKMTNLATLKFADGVKVIGTNAFHTCSGLLSFSLPTGLKTIGQGAFYSCKGIQTMTFPEGMEEIGQSAFDGCTSLTTVKFGEGLKTIKTYAFASCYALTYVGFANSIETIGYRAFWRTMLNKIILPENLKTLGSQAFVWGTGRMDMNGTHVQSLTIPSKVTKIEDYAFSANLWDDVDQDVVIDTIYVHMAPYEVPSNAFGVRSGQTLVVPKGMRDLYSTTKGWRNSDNVIEGDWEPEYDKSPFVIGSTSIDEGMSVTQSGITYRLYAKEGRQAHLYSDLTNYPDDVINLPEEIYFRGNNYRVTGVEMFKSNRVVDLVLSNTVTSIQAIKSGVKTLNVPATVTSISGMYESADLLDFKVDAGNETYCDVDGVLYSKDKKTLQVMPYGRRTIENMSVTIPEGVEKIASNAFYKMTNITRLQTNAELREIGNNAFQGCSSISSLTLTEGLKVIGAYNFAGCKGLGRLTFPKGLEEIGNNAFDGCTNLTKITFGEGLKAIRTYAFASCYALTNVDFANSIETIEYRAFWRTILIKVVLPENLQTLGSQAFVWGTGDMDMNGTHLQSLTIPPKVTSIGDYAFSANLGGGVDRDVVIDTVYTHIMEPMHINSNAFGTITNTVLVVPTGTKADYLLYNGWKDFGDRIEESDALLPTASRCATPTFKREGNTLTISTTTDGATIYYTMNGSDPTIQDLKYDADNPITLTENGTVKAIAIKEELNNSEIATYKVDLFTVADVKIALENLQIVMSTETEGATIRYTLDGSDPTGKSTVYQGMPLSMAEACTIKAIGMKQNWNNSRITTYDYDPDNVTCLAPTFRLAGKQLVIETATVDGVIYYTLDETEPTTQSTKYESPVTLTRNCTLKAIVTKEGYRNSRVATFEAMIFQATEPTFSVNGTTLTISCATEGAAIYYGIGEQAEPTTRYEAPLALTDNQPVKAIAKLEGYKDSPVAEYRHSLISCQPATLDKYDGRYFTLTVQEGAKAYYTLDGSTPTESSEEYTGRTPITERCTLKTIAVKQWMNNSEVSSYDFAYFFNGESADVTTAGQLQQSMEWGGTDGMTTLKVNGPLNVADLAYVKQNLTGLQHLDLSRTTIEGHALPTEAFAGMQLVTFVSSRDINSVGDRIFANCSQLAAIVWNSSEKIPDNALGDQKNPNLLVYTSNRLLAPAGVVNVVQNGSASSIVLTDPNEANNNFFCPQAIRA
ncbi:MAG: leucine-rich repeat protein [Prevotella sp.]|nr:leucine-rich repeat protein [Prevotella sp.]